MKNGFMQLHNKNVNINVWFNLRLKLFSVIPLFVTGNRHLFTKVPDSFLFSPSYNPESVLKLKDELASISGCLPGRA